MVNATFEGAHAACEHLICEAGFIRMAPSLAWLDGFQEFEQVFEVVGLCIPHAQMAAFLANY